MLLSRIILLEYRNVYISTNTSTSTMNKVKCYKCGHEWETKSKFQYVSCPSCLQKVKIMIKEAGKNKRS